MPDLDSATTDDLLAEIKARILSVDRVAKQEPCPWYTDGNSWALWSGPPAKRRCIWGKGHDGEHR